MNKTVMTAIEALSTHFNFPVDEAVNFLNSNKKSKSKSKSVSDNKEVEDLFAQLVTDATETRDSNESQVSATVEAVVEENKEKKEKKPKAKKAEPVDEMAKALMALEKKHFLAEQKRLDALEKKQKKEAADLAKKEALALEKEQKKEAAALAKKEAALEKKKAADLKKPAAEKKEKKVSKPAAEKKEKKVEDSPDRPCPAFVEPQPVKVSVRRVTIGGQEYLKSGTGILYNPETKEEVGIHDEVTNTIKALPDDDEEELDEDEYATDDM